MSTLEMDRKTVGIWLGVIGILALVAMVVAGAIWFRMPRVAYFDTARLMVSFSEAANIDKGLKAEDDKWRAQLKMMELRSPVFNCGS